MTYVHNDYSCDNIDCDIDTDDCDDNNNDDYCDDDENDINNDIYITDRFSKPRRS